MQEIETGTLRQWLEDGRPVSVLDIRTPEDREQWSIPESLHVNAYERLKACEPDALAGVDLPTDRPVVTICNAGKVSQVAAGQLRKRGLDAYPLAGGMKAWSLAWNTAELGLSAQRPARGAPAGAGRALTSPADSPRAEAALCAELVESRATVVQVRRTGKGCLSYLIGSRSEAVVIDASLDPAVYLQLAAQRGWSIRHVLDTHIHADHLSRSRALAELAGASLLLPAQDRVRFRFAPVEDGQEISFGEARIRAISTPGHTMESACYDLSGEALFTGDTLFLSGVGRPDLHASTEEARDRARILHRSLRRLCDLPSSTLVLPGHTSQPVAFDRKPLFDQLGRISSRIAPWLENQEDFVRTILARIPPAPPNFSRIVELNEAGVVPEGDLTDLEAGANRCAVS